ncbi:indolethylamine N-methyltransferase [Trichonephila clavipes]|nr:indolethylamine N-methyltransferase [Trichonephila clavipes]
MEDTEKKIKEDYTKNLDPKKFKEFKLEGLKAEKSENNYDFWFRSLHEFFSSKNYTGNRMLELGSGPTVHNIATASAYFSHIVLSEFVESNCEQLRKWLRKDPDMLDWTIFLERVARAEGRKGYKDDTESHRNAELQMPQLEAMVQRREKNRNSNTLMGQKTFCTIVVATTGV